MSEWKTVRGYEGRYEVSDTGEVRSLIGNMKTLKGAISTKGYRQVALRKEGKTKFKQVHRLVAEAFLGEPNSTVNHINGDKTDNRAKNLEWASHRENIHHALANGLNRYAKRFEEYAIVC